MAIFTDCLMVLDVKELSIKEKNKLKTAIKNNDGIISYLVNRQCTHVVTSDLNTVSSSRLKAIQKYNIPVVNLDYIHSCIKEGQLLDISCYKPCEPTPLSNDDGDGRYTMKATKMQLNIEIPQEEMQGHAENFRFISAYDNNIPPFPPDFEVVKYSILAKNENGAGAVVVIELQVSKKNGKFPFRISSHFEKSQQQNKQFIFTAIAEEAEEAYDWCIKKLIAQEFTVKINHLSAVQHLASEKLQQLIIEEALNTSRISNEVGVFVEMVWAEAQGHLEDQLISPTSITLNDVTRAEGLLLQMKKAIDDKSEEETLRDLMSQFYSILLIKPETDFRVNKRKISEKQDLCQLIRDVLNASEATSWTPVPSSLTKCHALRCQIEYVDLNSDEFLHVKNQLLNTNKSSYSVKILQIFRVARLSETKNFQSQLGNIQQLYHASSGSNFVGILSRGLLLPKTVVENYGVERTDVGNLGSGIYFSNSISTSAKYSEPNRTDGSRLLVICDVSLGKCKKYYKKNLTLSVAPAEYSSVHGIRRTESIRSEFEDDEFVVYSTSQVKMKYVVQFCIGEDQLKPFHPLINVTPEEISASTFTSAVSDIDDLEAAQDPLKDIQPGLQDSAGNVIPLQEIHVEAKLMDLVAQVMVFQSYTNPNIFPIEAKYVFPLDDTAAVCGFEAFINGKHIIGQVKEKQQAHHEYRQAIKQGHGAYLMDQAAADVFTISIGNLPPNASVIIKITYITELSVDREYISFVLPGSVTSQQRDKALQEKTQEFVKNINMKGQEPAGLSLNLSLEMPYEIKEISSPTHSIKIKRTDCTAVISVEQNSCLGNGFQLLILLAEIHAPRMWVENNPEKDSQACMLAFYPEFDVGTLSDCEAIICLDCSFSMRGLVLEQAKKVALLILRYLPTTCRFNVITFGTDYKELFCCSQQRNSEDAANAACNFILSVQKPMGNTDFWRPLLSLNLLAPSKRIRNVLLISDGHIQNEALTLKTVHQNVKHTRIFTFGVGSTANRHTLRLLAQYGGGAYETFDKNTRFSWKAKVLSQVDRVTQPGCNSISVKWEQFSLNASGPVQAPAQIHSVFSNSRLLIYGFVPHCTQATLSAVINNQEVSTMVSTTELQKTKGKILHRLTARALIGDYENGSLHTDESEHEMMKSTLKSYITELSKEYSIVTQFTSFVAIEERDEQEEDLLLGLSIQELAAKESVDILPYMEWEEKFKWQEFKVGASRRKLLGERKCFSKKTSDDYDELHYDETPSRTSTQACMEYSLSMNILSTSSEQSLESLLSLNLLLDPLFGPERAALGTSETAATEEAADGQYLKYSSSDEGSQFSLVGASAVEVDSVSDAAFLEHLALAPTLESSTLFGSGFSASVARTPRSSAIFVSGFSATGAPITQEKSHLGSNFSASGAPPHTPVNSAGFGSGFSVPAAPPTGSSAYFGSAFSTTGAPTTQEKSLFDSVFSASAAPPPPPPIPGNSAGFGSGFSATAAPSPGSSAYFGSAFSTTGAPTTQEKSLFDSVFSATAAPPPPPRSSAIFGSGFSATGAPDIGKKSHFGSEFSASVARIPRSSAIFGSGFSATGAPDIRKKSHFGSGSSVAAHPPPGGSGVLVTTELPDRCSDILGSHPLMAKAPTVRHLETSGFHSASSIGPAIGSTWSSGPAALPVNSLVALQSRPFLATAFPLGKSKGFVPRLQMTQAASFNGFMPAPLSAFQDQNMVHQQMPQFLDGHTCAITADSFIFEKSQNFKENEKRCKTSLHGSQPFSFQNLKKDPEAILSNNIKRSQKGKKHFKERKGWPEKSIFLQRKKEDRAKVLRSKSCEIPWTMLFKCQNENGYWNFTSDLGVLLEINVDYLTNVFLIEKGIKSLGHRAAEEIVSLIATLMILQLIRFTEQLKGIEFKSLLCLELTLDSRTTCWALEHVKKAIAWARNTDRQYPAICSRLELGRDWESATRQLLQIDPLKKGSPLQQLFN
ncbi:protein mono-ADP-ribosyltransferase PARP4 isoform X3 [Heterodontus francisci]|uniref:protein mono-ADP-ribosyltransferase PARP4 isoform X3 n=1 Tax=Heterodontus francisci TaxID=7792 RepID=UPI00355C248B